MEQDLAALYEAIRQGATERGLAVFPGYPAAGNIVHWDGEWPEFLDIAAKLKAEVLYLERVAFSVEEAIDEACGHVRRQSLRTAEENQARRSEPEEWITDRLEKAIRPWKKREGETTSITALWLSHGVGHVYRACAEWTGAMDAALEEACGVFDDEMEEVRTDLAKEEAVRLFGLAEKMARHDRYTEANNEAKRRYMAQQLFPEESSSAQRDIADYAMLYYWWHLEPGERASKAEKVRELRQRGEPICNIAALLRLSEAKVKQLLLEGNF